MRVSEYVNLWGWPNCVVCINGETKCVATTAVGPRIPGIFHKDDEICDANNIFGGFPEQLGKSGEAGFQLRTGRRMWFAPEVEGPMTYDLDNGSVQDVSADNSSLTILQEPGYAGFQKSLIVKGLQHERDGLLIMQGAENWGKKCVDGVALWGLNAMAMRGTAIIPRPAFQYHPGFARKGTRPELVGGFLPAQNVVFWPYTSLKDPRVTFGSKFFLLRQDPDSAPDDVNKFGFSDVRWVAYAVQTAAGARLFIERLYYTKSEQSRHPDHGSVCEVFVCNRFLEIESLGPMSNLVPGVSAPVLCVRWTVHKLNTLPQVLTDEWIETNVVPLVGTFCVD